MMGLGKLTTMAGPRLLLVGMIITGMLGSQGGNGTLAFFTSTVSSTSTFRAGVVDLTGVAGTSGSASVLPTADFSWETAAGGNCKNILTGTDVTNERMQPGHYCVTPFTIKNASNEAVDSWLRLRLVRNTATDAAALATPSAPTVTYQTTGGSLDDGTTYSYRISAVARNVDNSEVETVAGTAGTVSPADNVTSGTVPGRTIITWTAVPRALAYRIYGRTSGSEQLIATVSASVTTYIDTGAVTPSGALPSAPTTNNVPGPNDQLNNRLRIYIHEYTGGGASNAGDTLRSTAQTNDCVKTVYKPSTTTFDAVIGNLANAGGQSGVTRTALTSLGTSGKAIGRALANADINTLTSANAAAAIATGQLNLRTGAGTATPLAESSMVTNNTATDNDNAFNIIGNDEVTDPAGGTDANGTTAEAELVNTFGTDAPAASAKSVRYFCAAIFFPSNTNITATTGAATDSWNTSGDAYNHAGDNAAAAGNNQYTLHITAAQKAGR